MCKKVIHRLSKKIKWLKIHVNLGINNSLNYLKILFSKKILLFFNKLQILVRIAFKTAEILSTNGRLLKNKIIHRVIHNLIHSFSG